MTGEQVKVKVRPAQAHEIDEIIGLLRHNFVPQVSAKALRGLFEYHWGEPQTKPTLGYVLSDGDRIVGFIGAIYAERPCAGSLLKTCNLSTLYVLPEFRSSSMKLLLTAVSQRAYNLTSLTASPTLAEVLKPLGFQHLEKHKRVYLGWQFGRDLLHRIPEVISDRAKIRELLRGEDRRIFEDHQPYPVKHYVVRDGDSYCYLVIKRRRFPGHAAFAGIPIRKIRLMWYPCMEVLYLSDPKVALKKWGRLVSAIVRSEKVLAVVAPEGLLGEGWPAAPRIDSRRFVLTRQTACQPLDSLYSELVTLPI